MYKKYLVVKPTSNKGYGVFTTIDLPANVPLFEVRGDLFSSNNLPDPNHPAILQVGKDKFIGASGDTDDYINHSCDPNCFMHIVGHRAICYSLYQIRKGSELLFDYSTTSTDDHSSWKMNCSCGSYKCRKIISGFHYLDHFQQQEYKEKDILPLYISHPLLVK